MYGNLEHKTENFRRSGTRKSSEMSIIASRMLANNYKIQNTEHSISILMLETHLSDICKTVSLENCITEALYIQVPAMTNILNDCMNLSNISLEFYRQVERALSFIVKIYEYSCSSLLPDLVQLLVKIVDMIHSYDYLSNTLTVPIKSNKYKSNNEILAELKVRINRVTPRVINIWRKILSPIKEFERVCYGFIRFYFEVDPLLKGMAFEDPVAAMYRYARNPGHVVQTIRKTLSFLESESISLKNAREVHEIVHQYPPEVIGCVDKTMSGYVIWDLIRCSLDYYQVYGLHHYNVDIFQKDLILDDHTLLAQDSSLLATSSKILPTPSTQSIKKSPSRNKPPRITVSSNLNTKKVPTLNLSPFLSPPKFENIKRKNPPIKNKDLSFEDHTSDYETYISEKFQEFLLEKMKNKSEKVQIDLLEKRSELLLEFNEYIATLDHDKISELWEQNNYSQETSRLYSRLSL
ncbi:hypothetical protein SteCoe_22242 [Stentor coeruleus]|uniref:Uncharacterized protein n=1 Tax=Stentor coeruleus TaxID=5963 RepID=A0A1R2BMP3_9CILI|nr:hypothetical protein SteCoe_22242 [Stentor coeruleus]